MLLIGLTGNIASGKSEVARMLAERGATLIDADVLAREAVRPETQALKDIVKRWARTFSKKMEASIAPHCVRSCSRIRTSSTPSIESFIRV